MTSGQQQAALNLESFLAWVSRKTDDELRAMTHRGSLMRKEIAKECGFARSVLEQNPKVQVALRQFESDLRARGVLPPLAPTDPDSPVKREPGGSRKLFDAERLKRLEQENAALRAEVAELRRTLDKFVVLRDALAMTGRLPR